MAAIVLLGAVVLLLPSRVGLAPTRASDDFSRAPLRGLVMVVDPGHGGIDSGAVERGIQEKGINLAISRALARELRGLGAQVALTRVGDQHLATGPGRYARDRRRRAELVAKRHAQLFVSIHANHVSWSSARGPIVIWSPEAAPGSRALAAAIGAAIRRETGFRSGLRRLRIKVLRWAGVPAALVETGFLSNPRDRAALTNPAYQVRMAVAIADGVRAYWIAERLGWMLRDGLLWGARTRPPGSVACAGCPLLPG